MNHPNILNCIEENYFLNPPKDSLLFNYVSIKRWEDYSISNEDKEKMENIYKEMLDPNYQFGFSKSENATYIKMYATFFYDKGGFTTLPLYLLCSKETHDVFKKEDPKYKDEWETHNFKTYHEIKKRLLYFTYNHVLEDGKILEFVFDENQVFKEHHSEQIFHFVKTFREAIKLENELPINTETGKSGKRMKI